MLELDPPRERIQIVYDSKGKLREVEVTVAGHSDDNHCFVTQTIGLFFSWGVRHESGKRPGSPRPVGANGLSAPVPLPVGSSEIHSHSEG